VSPFDGNVDKGSRQVACVATLAHTGGRITKREPECGQHLLLSARKANVVCFFLGVWETFQFCVLLLLG
jgi:hypothetical protein